MKIEDKIRQLIAGTSGGLAWRLTKEEAGKPVEFSCEESVKKKVVVISVARFKMIGLDSDICYLYFSSSKEGHSTIFNNSECSGIEDLFSAVLKRHCEELDKRSKKEKEEELEKLYK